MGKNLRRLEVLMTFSRRGWHLVPCAWNFNLWRGEGRASWPGYKPLGNELMTKLKHWWSGTSPQITCTRGPALGACTLALVIFARASDAIKGMLRTISWPSVGRTERSCAELGVRKPPKGVVVNTWLGGRVLETERSVAACWL